jgi:hypothetical protein
MTETDFHKLSGPQRKILRETLTSVFGRKSLTVFLEENDFGSLEDLAETGTFQQEVFNLIGELTSVGRLNRFMSAVRRDFPDSPHLLDLEQKLAFAGREAENQRVVHGTGLERMVRDAGFADLNLWADRLVAMGRRVCRITYPLPGGLMRGTGFLICPDLVLTNYHVVEYLLKGAAEPAGVRLQFGYAETADGAAAGQMYGLAGDWMAAASPYSAADLAPNAGLPASSELDFALIRLDTGAGGADLPSGKRGWIDLSNLSGGSAEGSIVFVLQHAEGKPLKHSIGVVKQAATSLRLLYDADTEHGSSGGLVLDHELNPLALHHAGDPDARIKARFNQGIPLHLIRSALESNPAVTKCW